MLNKYLKCSVWRLALRYDIYIYIYMSLGFKRLRKYLAQNLITMSHLFQILLLYKQYCKRAYDITRNFPKSSLGCNPGFENPFSIIMQYDMCITRNYVLKQPNINFKVAVTKFLLSRRSVDRKSLIATYFGRL